MTPATAIDVVHHLYPKSSDLVLYCGMTPGPDSLTGNWHTGHDRDLLLECVSFGLCVCRTCLSPEALGGWTPLMFDEEDRGC